MPQRFRTAALLTAGVTACAGLALPVTAHAATVTCKPNYFKRTFYANTGLSGTPKKTDCDDAINQNYRSASPLSGIAKDNFSMRWTVTRDFGSGGPFAFAAESQDGIRVYVDNVRKIDLWKNVATTQKKTLNLTIPKGKHTLRIDFAAWTGNANVKFSYAPRTSATVDKTAPLTPTGIKAGYSATTLKSTVSWAKSPEMDLAGYRVYRRLKGTATYTKVAQTTATSYADTPPATGQVFYYEARAYDKAGRESTGTADMPVTTVDRTAPAQVTGLTALGTTAGNSLGWQASSADVDHYEVWAAPAGGQDPDGPELVLGTSYTDPVADAGTAYTYTVRAVDASANVSPASAPVTVARPVASTTPAPASLRGEPLDAFTELNWAPADASAPAPTAFHIYRRTAPTGAWALVGTAGASDTSYEDRSAPKGSAFYFVAAVDDAGTESAPSAAASVSRLTPATATGPLAPQLTLVSSGTTRSPIQIGIKPGAGDEGRLLSHYTWDISGACGDSGAQTTTAAAISWTPTYNGPCAVTVFAVDAYGRSGAQGTSLEFMVNR
ncbi:fibronectin type III domain-containing protein [Streptomyces sp. NBC_01465]|uniref:fibronectin type III domain-containing protein n=1 Tax=Streptomyces sp. NBC_01465 TaxID=2903878 RepID=UPI002E2FC750|nr:PA14 domain-containing protein [Streptomyces sp. NBC_01465]